MQSISNISRYLLAILFTFSGLVKAVDPYGLAFKLDEYFSPEVFNLPFLEPISLLIAVAVIGFELFLGIRLFLAYRNRTTLWMVMGLNLFFGFLTFYSAHYNVVQDCGCFGDFLKMSPWASFYKNVGFAVLTIFGLIGSDDVRNKIKFAGQWIILSFFVIVMFFSIFTLPLIDFRPYHLQADLKEGIMIPDDAPQDKFETLWYYKVGGEEKQFQTHEEPWNIEGAEFVKRETKLVEKGYVAPMSDFVVYDSFDDDATQTLMQNHSTAVWVIVRGEEAKEDLREIIEEIDHDYSHWIVISDLPISTFTLPIFRDRVYFADEILLKTMIRSKLGFFKLSNGIIKRKSHAWEAIISNALLF